jgi:hypothetical protein
VTSNGEDNIRRIEKFDGVNLWGSGKFEKKKKQ